MLTILTPSKTMDFVTPAPAFIGSTRPLFSEQAARLRDKVATLSVKQIASLMHVSQPLAEKTQAMYSDTISKQAFWAYDGDVFKGVQAQTMTAADAIFAQKHVLVPSGLYGLVRPYDMISPYRLEMKAKLAVAKTANLYEFWGSKLGQYVDAHAAGEVLMLSSYEYARTILPFVSDSTRVVTPVFINKKPSGQEEQIAIYNKIMRGVMGRWVINNKIDSLASITEFKAQGYEYSSERSSENKPVFYCPEMTPLRFID